MVRVAHVWDVDATNSLNMHGLPRAVTFGLRIEHRRAAIESLRSGQLQPSGGHRGCNVPRNCGEILGPKCAVCQGWLDGTTAA